MGARPYGLVVPLHYLENGCKRPMAQKGVQRCQEETEQARVEWAQ